MLETYKIGVSLDMTTNVLGTVEKLLRDMETLDRRVKDTGGTFTKLASDIRELSSASRSIGALNRAMEKLSTTGAGKAVTDMDRMAAATRSITESSEQLTRVLRENAELAGSMAKAMESAGRASRAGGGGAGGHGGRFTAHDGMMLGMGASMVGDPILHGAENAFERGVEVGHLRAQILADKRVTPAQADSMVSRAYDATTSAPGTRVTSNLESLIDLKNVTGSLDEAEKMLPKFAQLSALLGVIDRKRGGDGAFSAAKAMEIMGGMIDEHQDASGHTVREINPEMLQRRLDLMARVAVATNGRVAPQDFLGFAKQARVAGMNLSDEFIYEKLPAIMMATGGQRAGTALMSMAQVFDGGKLEPKSMEALQAVGLAGKGGITRRRNPRTGKMEDHVNSSAIYDMDVMRTDPSKWAELATARMDKAGIHGTEAQIIALMKASQRSTIAGFLADMLKDAPAILKEQQNIQNTRPDVAGYFAQNDPAAKLQQMQAAFDKLVTTLGSAIMNDAVRLMDAITSGLNAMADWGRNNPLLARVLTDTAIGLGAIATALGTLSVSILMFAPALKLMGVAGGGGAAAAGAGAAAGGTTLLGRALAGIASPWGALAGAIGGSLFLGSEYETPETRKRQEDLARARRGDPMQNPTDGYGDGSGLVRRQSYQPGGTTLLQPINMMLDGRKLGDFVIRVAEKALGGPSHGMTGFDPRATPQFSGALVNT